MKKGLALTTMAEIILAVIALTVLAFVLAKLSPAVSDFAAGIIDKFKTFICDELTVVKNFC